MPPTEPKLSSSPKLKHYTSCN